MVRRLTLLLVGLAVVAAGCGTGGAQATGPTTTDPPPPTPGSTPTTAASSPPRLLFAGDSLMEEIHAVTAAALGDGAETRFLLSPRLIRDGTQELLWQSALDGFEPDVVVVVFSHWERLVLGAQRPEDIDDVAAYDRLVARPFAQFIADNDAELIWLSAPPLEDDRITAVYRVMNEAFRAAADASPRARFVDLAPVLTDEAGAYADVLPNAFGVPERMRQTDGIHLCPGGGVLVAEAVLAPVTELTGVTAVGDWQNGDWRGDEAFRRPASCPAL